LVKHPGQGFLSSYDMRRPITWRLVALMYFGWDDEHQTRTLKILQSLCVSHKIVETYRNQHAPKFSKGKMGMMCQWQHWPVSSQDVTPS
jgi:hypothetical protein